MGLQRFTSVLCPKVYIILLRDKTKNAGEVPCGFRAISADHNVRERTQDLDHTGCTVFLGLRTAGPKSQEPFREVLEFLEFKTGLRVCDPFREVLELKTGLSVCGPFR